MADTAEENSGYRLTTGIVTAASEPVRIVAAAERTTNIPVIRNRTTVVPSNKNKTPVADVAKSTTARPTVTIPVGILLAITFIAGAGIIAFMYLLFSRRARLKENGKGESGDGAGNPDHATLVPAPSEPPEDAMILPPGPAIQFPPSLEKRFPDPVFIGEGGIARVFRARNAKTGQVVAVKVPLRFDEVTGTHFIRDMFLWQGLRHENIIEIYSTNILPVPYVEMEYAPSSLASGPFPLPEEEALRVITGIARGLAFAHANGIVHRDIKPENILMAEDGKPKITDWGLGKSMSDPRQSTLIGYSPGYAAPEQIAPHVYGKAGAATDIYQLGILFAELLTGAIPFAHESMHDTNVAILNDPVPSLSWEGKHVPEIRAIIEKCLARRPEERYASVAELLAELEAVGQC